MKKFLFISIIISELITSCATPQPETLKQANQIVPKLMTFESSSISNDAYKLAYNNDPGIEKAYQEYLRTGRAPNIITQGFQQFAYGNTQPIINASPLELTVITLEEGESVTNVSSGDPLRWSYSLAYSGQGKDKQAHIMIKPSQSNISTDLVITTDKRLYTLKLVSTQNNKYARNIKFWYPDEIQDYWNNQQNKNTDISTIPNIDLNKMNFNYEIKSSFFNSPSWKPTRVFDDGTHTYIQFPDGINTQDLPALFVMNQNNNKELVNYRVKKPYFVVDKIFKEAALIMGAGNNQTQINIMKQN